MENITLAQIVAAIGILTTIGAFIAIIYKWYKRNFSDKFDELDKRLTTLENQNRIQEEDIKDSKAERLVIVRGLLACLKGLHDDLKCNGPVTKGIQDIENYLEDKSHN